MTQSVISTDIKGTILSWNRAAEELYGRTGESVIGSPLREALPADRALAELPVIFEVLRAGGSWSATRQVNHQSLVLLTGSPVRDDGENVSGFVFVSIPLDGLALPPPVESERLRQREAQLHQAQQIARIASWSWHVASDALEESAELLEILGLDPTSNLTLTELLNSCVHPEDRDRLGAACQRASVEDLPLDVECRFRAPIGAERVLHLRAQRVLDQSGDVERIDGVAQDVTAILEYEGISTDWVRLGAEAVERIAARLPDVVILDLGLPDVNGIRLYEEIAGRWPGLPILFSTGHGDEKLLTNTPGGKLVGYLQKPYTSDVLIAALEELLR